MKYAKTYISTKNTPSFTRTWFSIPNENSGWAQGAEKQTRQRTPPAERDEEQPCQKGKLE
jgi:hypothetical protein